MANVEELEKAKQNFNKEQIKVKKEKVWLTYNQNDDVNRRQVSRKILHITSILKELGYPIRVCYTADTLKQMCGNCGLVDVDDKQLFNIAVIEFNKLEGKILEEINKFLESRNIVIISTIDYVYNDNNIEVTRIYITLSSIKEGI